MLRNWFARTAAQRWTGDNKKTNEMKRQHTFSSDTMRSILAHSHPMRYWMENTDRVILFLYYRYSFSARSVSMGIDYSRLFQLAPAIAFALCANGNKQFYGAMRDGGPMKDNIKHRNTMAVWMFKCIIIWNINRDINRNRQFSDEEYNQSHVIIYWALYRWRMIIIIHAVWAV